MFRRNRRYENDNMRGMRLPIHNSHGQTLVEYVLLIVLIALTLITAMKVFQGNVTTTYTNAASTISKAP